ncbi:hypothetical protein AAVH_25289 [Aphelenchoides avenae]|nr:hypothetical protein AAVH_25289 [Aphelenchus avenae]
MKVTSDGKLCGFNVKGVVEAIGWFGIVINIVLICIPLSIPTGWKYVHCLIGLLIHADLVLARRMNKYTWLLPFLVINVLHFVVQISLIAWSAYWVLRLHAPLSPESQIYFSFAVTQAIIFGAEAFLSAYFEYVVSIAYRRGKYEHRETAAVASSVQNGGTSGDA